MVDYTQKGRALFIDDEMHVRLSSSQTLELAGFEVTALERATEAIEMINQNWTGVVVSDVKMPGVDGIAFLEAVTKINPDIPIILITGHGDVEMAVEAMQQGAYDFLEKPFASERLIDVVSRAMEKHNLLVENKNLRQKLESGNDISSKIFGKSKAIQDLRETIKNVAPTDTDVLITGETGTGKELVARCLHENSTKRSGHFVAVNCGAMPDVIFESELFGHEPNALPQNPTRRIGKVEYSSNGTLFLDEIETLELDMQIKLLRVLQERSVQRLGSNEEIKVNLRIIASSKDDLLRLVDEGKFRSDLYYRLSVMQIETPPLRDCGSDIPYLFKVFTEDCAKRLKRDIPEISQETYSQLLDHDWPGNVRELHNWAEKYILQPKASSSHSLKHKGLVQKMDAFEASLISQALEQTSGSIKEAMEILDIPRKTLTDKMRRHNINRQDFINK